MEKGHVTVLVELKRPCDGLSGTTKRMADEAVKSGKVVIQDATDFFAWAQSVICTMNKVLFIFVQSEVCKESANNLWMSSLKPINGTMKIHAVVGRGNNLLYVSDVSCYYQSCIQGDYCKANWTQKTLTEKEKIPSGVDVEINDLSITASNEMETEIPSHKQHNEEHFAIGDYVAATYLNKWYIGKILDIDEEDCGAEITFIAKD